MDNPHQMPQTSRLTLSSAEIDHNFSQAHRIVTTSVLPLIEQYSESSRDVWEGAKVWPTIDTLPPSNRRVNHH